MLVWRIASIVSAPTPYFGDKPIARITAFDMQRYIKQRRDHVTDATINRELSTLSHLLHRALEWQWIDQVIVGHGQASKQSYAGITQPQKKPWRLVRQGFDPSF